nr:hypothetical protein [Tanacetum cinerariifolium]
LKDNIISELPPCVAVTPNEPVDSLIMEDEHLNTIPVTESDEFIKSCVENLVPNPNGNTGTLNIKMMGGVSDQKVPIPNLMITRILNQEKSLDLLSHLGFEAFQPCAECPMIINGKNTPVSDVPLFHFYPLDQLKYGGISSSMGEFGPAQRPKTSASWEATHAYQYLPGILSNSNFTKDPSKVTEIELTAHMIDVNNQKDSVSLLPLSTRTKKGKSQTVTPTLPKPQGLEASGALSKKINKPKSKKTPTETKATSTPKPTKDSEQSHSVSSGTVPNPQDLERNIQLAST